MSPEQYIDNLSVEDCHKPLEADVAWLRMVWRHLKDASKSLHDKSKPALERIDNTYCGLDNAITYIEDQIYKTVEAQ